MPEQILQAIGVLVVAGGGLASIAYAIFRVLGEKWLNAKFEERLEAYKHEQQKELEQLRFRISALLDRTTKLHQREFDVLPEAWARLNDAYWKTLSFVSPGQRYPDLNKMSDTQLREFLAECDLDNWQRDEIWQEQDRGAYYRKHIFWHRLADTQNFARENHIYLLKNGIFLPDEVKLLFTDLDDLIWDALNEHEFEMQHEQIPRTSKKSQLLRSIGPEKIKALETHVQSRLWGTQSGAP